MKEILFLGLQSSAKFNTKIKPIYEFQSVEYLASRTLSD